MFRSLTVDFCLQLTRYLNLESDDKNRFHSRLPLLFHIKVLRVIMEKGTKFDLISKRLLAILLRVNLQ